MTQKTLYGRDFATVYSDHWTVWSKRMWPFLIKLVDKNLPDARNWLDVCCGTGQLLSLVTRHGYRAVGVDRSPHQLALARKNAPEATFHRRDVTNLALGKTFDVVTCSYDSLNYLTRKKDLSSAFAGIADHLEPGGLFIFDMNTYRGLEEHWNQTFTIEKPGLFVTVEAVFDTRKSLGTCRITGFIREGKSRCYRRFEEIHIERGYWPEDIEDLLDRSGLIVTGMYDGENFGRPKRKSGRLIYICRPGD